MVPPDEVILYVLYRFLVQCKEKFRKLYSSSPILHQQEYRRSQKNPLSMTGGRSGFPSAGETVAQQRSFATHQGPTGSQGCRNGYQNMHRFHRDHKDPPLIW